MSAVTEMELRRLPLKVALKVRENGKGHFLAVGPCSHRHLLATSSARQ